MFEWVSSAALPRLGEFNSIDFANIAWAYARLDSNACASRSALFTGIAVAAQVCQTDLYVVYMASFDQTKIF